MNPHDEDIWRGEVTSELRHVAHSVRDVQRQIMELQTLIMQEVADHRTYHEHNEHRWGIARWCQLHPFRLLAVALLTIGITTFHTQVVEMSSLLRLLWDAVCKL